MLHPMTQAQRSEVRALVSDADHLLLLHAVIEGSAPGHVYVDDPDAPAALFASGPEGHYVAGTTSNSVFNDALGSRIRAKVLPTGRERGWAVFNLYYEPGWEAEIEQWFSNEVLVFTSQRYFQYVGPLPEWQTQLGPTAAIVPVDAALLEREDVANLEWVEDFASGDYASMEAFFAQGFGACLLVDGAAVAWCTTDCVVGHQAELGIVTMPEQRRKGYAAVAAAAAVSMALERGITDIGWHCHWHNTASAATAVRAGFVERYSHGMLQVWLNPVDAHLVNGNLTLMAGDYAEAIDHYRKAFDRHATDPEARSPVLLSRRSDWATYRYHAACAAALADAPDLAREQLELAMSYGSWRQGGA